MEKPMQTLPMTEDQAVRVLRDVDTPPSPPDLLAKLKAEPRWSRLEWAVPAVLTAALAVALVIGFTLKPTVSMASVSLADVVRATHRQKDYTIVWTSIRGKDRTVRTFSRSGPLWRSSSLYGSTTGLADKTVILDPKGRFALVDLPRKGPVVEVDVNLLLRPGVTPTVERGVLWNGRTVDRYTLDDMSQLGVSQVNGVTEISSEPGPPKPVVEELIVDPATKLPIRASVMWKDGSYGDVVDYDFQRPPASVFKPVIPPQVKTYDLAAERKAILAGLRESNGAIVMDDEESRRVYVITPGVDDVRRSQRRMFQIEGIAEPMKLQVLSFFAGHESLSFVDTGRQVTSKEHYAFESGGKTWSVCQVEDWSQDKGWADRLKKLGSISGKMTEPGNYGSLGPEGETVHLKNLKIVRTWDAYSFLFSRFFPSKEARVSSSSEVN